MPALLRDSFLAIVACLCAGASYAIADGQKKTPVFEPTLEVTPPPTSPRKKAPAKNPIIDASSEGESRAEVAGPAQDRPPVLYVGLAAIGEMLGRTSKSSDGSTSGFGAIQGPALSVSGRFHLGQGKLWLEPWTALSVIGSKSVDGSSTTRLFPFGVNLAYAPSALELKAGFAEVVRLISGSGGQSVQKNGTSQSTFALPSGSSASTLMALDLGAGIQGKRVRFDLDFLVTGLFSARRAVDMTIGAAYGIL